MTDALTDTSKLTIDSVAFGGKGVGRLDGKVYFVADAIEGDEVIVKVVKDSGRYADAEVVEVVKESPFRGEKPCPYAGTCGGCQWMGVDYEKQLEWKNSFLVSSLKRIGKISSDDDIEILASPTIYNYRNRVLLRAHLEDSKLSIGYFKRASRDLVDIDQCLIAEEKINLFITRIKELDLAGSLSFRLELQAIPEVDGKNIVATVYPATNPCEGIDEVVNQIASIPEVHWTGLVFDLKDAPTITFDEQFGVRFLTLPGQFQQVNVAHNRNLRKVIKDLVDEFKPAKILDLFCGSGNISLPLADGKRYIEGIEFDKKAITVANKNVVENNLVNANYLSGDSENHLWKCAKGGEKFDMIIADPPRAGMYKAMVPLREIGPKHILYVSCDPATLARDLSYLTRKNRYKIIKLKTFDFFPNTFHVETIAVLERAK